MGKIGPTPFDVGTAAGCSPKDATHRVSSRQKAGDDMPSGPAARARHQHLRHRGILYKRALMTSDKRIASARIISVGFAWPLVGKTDPPATYKPSTP